MIVIRDLLKCKFLPYGVQLDPEVRNQPKCSCDINRYLANCNLDMARVCIDDTLYTRDRYSCETGMFGEMVSNIRRETPWDLKTCDDRMTGNSVNSRDISEYKCVAAPSLPTGGTVCNGQGKCVLSTTSRIPFCVCNYTYRGTLCEISLANERCGYDECKSRDKSEELGASVCQSFHVEGVSLIFRCACSANYSGDFCEVFVSDLFCRQPGFKQEDCRGRGSCDQSNINENMYNCTCNKNFHGQFCEKDYNNDCIQSCMNGGKCEYMNSSPKSNTGEMYCACKKHPIYAMYYTGEHCDGRPWLECTTTDNITRCDASTTVGECATTLCNGRGTCSQSVGNKGCVCNPFYLYAPDYLLPGADAAYDVVSMRMSVELDPDTLCGTDLEIDGFNCSSHGRVVTITTETTALEPTPVHTKGSSKWLPINKGGISTVEPVAIGVTPWVLTIHRQTVCYCEIRAKNTEDKILKSGGNCTDDVPTACLTREYKTAPYSVCYGIKSGVGVGACVDGKCPCDLVADASRYGVDEQCRPRICHIVCQPPMYKCVPENTGPIGTCICNTPVYYNNSLICVPDRTICNNGGVPAVSNIDSRTYTCTCSEYRAGPSCAIPICNNRIDAKSVGDCHIPLMHTNGSIYIVDYTEGLEKHLYMFVSVTVNNSILRINRGSLCSTGRLALTGKKNNSMKGVAGCIIHITALDVNMDFDNLFTGTDNLFIEKDATSLYTEHIANEYVSLARVSAADDWHVSTPCNWANALQFNHNEKVCTCKSEFTLITDEFCDIIYMPHNHTQSVLPNHTQSNPQTSMATSHLAHNNVCILLILCIFMTEL
jgi:hypothetical protein